MNLSKFKNYKCQACGKITTLDMAIDDRAMYPQIVCEDCESLADLYTDPEAVIGNIEDVENNNLKI